MKSLHTNIILQEQPLKLKSLYQNQQPTLHPLDDFENILFFEQRRVQSSTPDLAKIFTNDSKYTADQCEEIQNPNPNEELQPQLDLDFKCSDSEFPSNQEIQVVYNKDKIEELGHTIQTSSSIFKVQYINKQQKKIGKKLIKRSNNYQQALQRYRQKREKRKASEQTDEMPTY